MSTSTLATRDESAAALAGVAIDYAAVLRTLRLNPADPRTQALVLVCDRYGLDPVLKHVVLVEGNVYVTRDGLLHVAHKSGQLDGIEVVDEPKLSADGAHWIAKVSVYRKDMSRPFSYVGRYPSKGGNVKYAPEMAVKCAEVMALRRAFDVAIAAREELHDAAEQPITALAPVAVELDAAAVEALRDTIMDASSLDELRELWKSCSADGVLDTIVAQNDERSCTVGELIMAKRQQLSETPAAEPAAETSVDEPVDAEQHTAAAKRSASRRKSKSDASEPNVAHVVEQLGGTVIDGELDTPQGAGPVQAW